MLLWSPLQFSLLDLPPKQGTDNTKLYLELLMQIQQGQFRLLSGKHFKSREDGFVWIFHPIAQMKGNEFLIVIHQEYFDYCFEIIAFQSL